MIKILSDNTNLSFRWIDVGAPTPEELLQIAKDNQIHEAFITDVLQPEHLPKYEPVGDASFYILRYYAASDDPEADTIQEITNKIAVFHRENLVITIHKFEVPFLNDLKRDLVDAEKCKGSFHLLNRLMKSVLRTYDVASTALGQEIDDYESQTLLKTSVPPLLKGLYHVKRKIEVSKRLLSLSRDILERIDDPSHQDPNTRDTRDLYVRVLNVYESMADNTNHLMNLYFNISAQRTNEIIRVLTIFSVFFMPLTFVVGIYGMNFDFMPELRWKLGYPGVIGFMVLLTAVIYIWFKRRNWL